MVMHIPNRPTNKQPREKLLINGAKNLSDTELLAIFINSESKNNLAYSLLKHFGGIRNIFDATKEQICRLPGMDNEKYEQLQAILEVATRYLEEQLINTNVVSNAESAYLYFTAKLRKYKREVFACLFLNNQNRVVHYEELFYGTINNLTIHPREIAKIALTHNSSAVIFAHNHPAATSLPSHQDKLLTNALIKILRPLDIKVLDHIIIGNNDYHSLIDQDEKIRKSNKNVLLSTV